MIEYFFENDVGAYTIECGIIATLIAVLVIRTLKSVGTQLDAKFGAVVAQLD